MSDFNLNNIGDLMITGNLKLHLKRLKEGNDPAFLNELQNSFEGIKHYYDEYERALENLDGDICSTVYSFHNLHDRIKPEMYKLLAQAGEQLSCKEGCSNCCYLHVTITGHEAMLLADVMKHDSIAIDKDRLERQRGLGLNDWMDDTKISHQDRKCVFLGDDNKCSVYNFRPMACRTHYVNTDPALCSIEHGSQITGKLFFKDDEILISAMASHSGLGNMADQLHSAITNQYQKDHEQG